MTGIFFIYSSFIVDMASCCRVCIQIKMSVQYTFFSLKCGKSALNGVKGNITYSSHFRSTQSVLYTGLGLVKIDIIFN